MSCLRYPFSPTSCFQDGSLRARHLTPDRKHTTIALLILAAAAIGIGWWTWILRWQRQNLLSFDQVWTTVRDRHFDPDLGGTDWDAARDEFRPRVEAAESSEAVREILEEMLALLGQSHFAIIPAKAYDRRQRGRGTVPGLEVRIQGDRALVTRVAEGSAAAEAEILPGWEVVGVEGTKVADLLAAPDESGHPRLDSLWPYKSFFEHLHGPVGRLRTLELRDGRDQLVERRVRLGAPPGKRVQHFGNLPTTFVEIRARQLEGGYGYVAFSGFIDPNHVMTVFGEAMVDFATAPALIIDLRGNGGGSPEMVVGMLGWLIPQTIQIGTQHLRDLDLKVIVNPRPGAYGGPVAALVDELSSSGAEMFSAALQDLGRACIVGRRTAGEVLAARIERLPNGDGFVFVEANYTSAITGEIIEGVGVEPDIEVALSREELLAGRDLDIEAALECIASRGDFQIDPTLTTETRERIPIDRPDSSHDPEAAAVLDGFVAATGGVAAYQAISNRVSEIRFEIPAQNLTLSLTVYQARPNRGYTLTESDVVGRVEGGTDGETVWELRTTTGPRILAGVERAAFRRTNRLDGPLLWRPAYATVEHRGGREIAGRQCHVLQLIPYSGSTETRYYDQDSGLLIRVESEVQAAAGTVPLTIDFEDYREVDGILLPFRTRASILGQARISRLESVRHNVDLPDDLFDLPAEIRQLRDSAR